MKKSSPVMILILFMVMFVPGLILIPANVRGPTLYVGGIGPANYTTIQEAIDDADPGDTVYVYGGTYYGNIQINQTLSLVGEDRDTTFIGGMGTLVNISANWANMTGFTITTTAIDEVDTGIRVHYANNCNISRNNASHNRYGIGLHSSHNNTIMDNIISSNGMEGIYLEGSNGNTIANNSLLDNRAAISLVDSDNNTLANNSMSNGYAGGISLWKSASNALIGNNVSNFRYGISLRLSSNNTLAKNLMIENGIDIVGSSISHWNTHAIPTSNTVNGNPVHYWKDVSGGRVPLGAGQVILANCTDVIVENQNLRNGSVGIQLGFSSHISIANNTVTHNEYGIHLEHSGNSTMIVDNRVLDNELGIHLFTSDNITVSANEVVGNDHGIHVFQSRDIEISNNTASENEHAIILDYSETSIIVGNTATNNTRNGIYLFQSDTNKVSANDACLNFGYGIALSSSDGNTVLNNTVRLNRGRGISVESSNGNTIYHNSIIDNSVQAHDDTSTNEWDNGYPFGGNYWSDHDCVDELSGPNQDRPGSDGICDTPYDISWGAATDTYPLARLAEPTLDDGSVFEQPRFWIAVAVVIVVILLAVLILVRRRKEKQGEGESPESG